MNIILSLTPDKLGRRILDIYDKFGGPCICVSSDLTQPALELQPSQGMQTSVQFFLSDENSDVRKIHYPSNVRRRITNL